jgi:NAD(P)-dependent dehydrogenase (short-subunit alcohol dehydrogenase family)
MSSSANAASSALFSVIGKNCLITGGSRGIGLMIATAFVRHGANVLLTSRDESACKDAAGKLDCHYVSSNVSTREGCRELVKHAAELFDGKLHILINNAGTSWGENPGYDGHESGKANWGWDKVLDLNVKGMFYLTRECVPLLEKSASLQDPARIINIGSVAGLVPQEAPTHAYDASKAAVHQLTRKMAADLAARKITVNAIAPGFVETRMSAGLGKWGATTDKVASSVPLGRMGNQDDMGGACIYLSSKAGSWCTGIVLPVDGGTVGALQIPLSSL